MQLALRPYSTAGVALVGASVVAAAALAPAMPNIQLPDVQTAAIELTASPLDLITDAATNLAITAANVINSPFMILQQVLDNFGTEATGFGPIIPGTSIEIWSGGFIPVLFNALGNAGHVAVEQLQVPVSPLDGTIGTIPAFEALIQSLSTGGTAAAMDDFLHALNVVLVAAGLPLGNVLSIPGDIFDNIGNGFDHILSPLALAPFLNAVLGPGQSFLAGFADGIQAFQNSGNPLDLLGAPIQAIDGFVNGIPGAVDGAAGLLQASFLTSTGGIGTLPFFNYGVPELFANGLGGSFDNFNPDILTDGTDIFGGLTDGLESILGNAFNILTSPIDLVTELLGISI